jgi:nitrogen fixation protein NifQ
MSTVAAGRCDPFDAHVFASILSIATEEAARNGHSPLEGTGLDSEAMTELVADQFPGAMDVVPCCDGAEEIPVNPDEMGLRELLRRNTTDGTQVEEWLAILVARRAQRPNHLWQDLGLRDRGELSRLMTRHFAPLAECNTRDMKWKKFLYRLLCRDEGFSLCTAPCCSECTDIDACFGDEQGKSLLSAHHGTRESNTP